jgi:hypothetical protein
MINNLTGQYNSSGKLSKLNPKRFIMGADIAADIVPVIPNTINTNMS